MDIGTLTGSIKLEDQFSSGLNVAVHHIQKFAGELEGALGAAVLGAGAAVTSILQRQARRSRQSSH